MSWLRTWRTRQWHRCCGLAHYSTPARRHDSVTVPCNSNGSIIIDIHHPLITPPTVPTILLHLPTGPSLSENASTSNYSNAAVLQATAHLPFTLVQINYRYGNSHYFPSPVHDVLAGFDWVRDNLLLRRAISRTGRSDRAGRIAVCGEGLGGTLATMLALTECRRNEPGIIAAAVHNPILDWVELDLPIHKTSPLKASTSRRSSRKTTVASDEAAEIEAEQRTFTRLQHVRKTLFARPEHYFDPFASPILFFRAPGNEVPPLPRANEMETWQLLDDADFHRQQLALSAVSLNSEEHPWKSADGDMLPAPLVARRKTSRRFPSASLGLVLPPFHISSSPTEPLRGQATELAMRLRQSIARQKVESMKGSGHRMLTDEELDALQDDHEVTENESVQHHIISETTESTNNHWHAAASWLNSTLA